MTKFLGPYSEYAYAAMRVVVGFLLSCHGAQKLFGALGGQSMLGDPLMLVAGCIEFFGGILIAIGLIASYAAFIASGELAVAYFKVHGPHGFWPILNRANWLWLCASSSFTLRFAGQALFRWIASSEATKARSRAAELAIWSNFHDNNGLSQPLCIN